MPENRKVICCDINNNEKEVIVEKLSFRPSVYGVLIKNNKILLSRQWNGYDFPGGGIEMHETVEEALRREFKEETGIIVKSDKIIACRTSFFILPVSKKPVNSILIYFLCSKIDGKISTKYFSEDEKKYANKAEWVELDKINKIKFHNSIDSVKVVNETIKLID